MQGDGDATLSIVFLIHNTELRTNYSCEALKPVFYQTHTRTHTHIYIHIKTKQKPMGHLMV